MNYSNNATFGLKLQQRGLISILARIINDRKLREFYSLLFCLNLTKTKNLLLMKLITFESLRKAVSLHFTLVLGSKITPSGDFLFVFLY